MESFFPLSNNAQPDASILSSIVEASEPSPFEATPLSQSKPSSDTEVRKPRKRGRKSTKNFSTQLDFTGNDPISLTVESNVEIDEQICTHDLNKQLLDDVITTLDRVHDLSENLINSEVYQNEVYQNEAKERFSLMSTEQLVEPLLMVTKKIQKFR
ncbi:591_t:CDS:2 [Paraglomus occultum]|uniref:591_t:CDS:1 n=1 Tax=Paraglomus occultum TaxID=144539 RepID=A0A9N9FRP9_9GLOM|nr:591_t:CDS:2 [Paraglomus occultum]